MLMTCFQMVIDSNTVDQQLGHERFEGGVVCWAFQLILNSSTIFGSDSSNAFISRGLRPYPPKHTHALTCIKMKSSPLSYPQETAKLVKFKRLQFLSPCIRGVVASPPFTTSSSTDSLLPCRLEWGADGVATAKPLPLDRLPAR